ncbi:MAG: poly(R)-hydroxyalkanoic acid synthase subunit PhaE [Algiphilus sp.]
MQNPNWSWPFSAAANNPFFSNVSSPLKNPFDWSAWQTGGATSAQDPTAWMQQFFAQIRQAMPDGKDASTAEWQKAATALSDSMTTQWERWSELFSHAGGATRGSGAMHSGIQNLLDEQMAPLGLSREATRQMQELADVHAQMGPAIAKLQEALAGFPDQFQKALAKLIEQRTHAGQPVTSLHGMIDLWIEAGELAFADIAHSDAFSRAFGGFTDALSRAKIARSKWLDGQLQTIGLPTRTEMQTSHERLQQARRDIRALKREVAELRALVEEQQGSSARNDAAPAAPAAKKAAAKKSARKASGKQASAARKNAATNTQQEN